MEVSSLYLVVLYINRVFHAEARSIFRSLIKACLAYAVDASCLIMTNASGWRSFLDAVDASFLSMTNASGWRSFLDAVDASFLSMTNSGGLTLIYAKKLLS